MTHIMNPSLVNFPYKLPLHQTLKPYTVSTMSSWFSFILLVSLCFSFNDVSGARHRKERHNAVVLIGTVYCDTCFPQEVPKSTHFISGATVAVECGSDGGKPRYREEVKTNEKGEFEAKLPVSIGKHVDRIKGCSVKLVSSSEPFCAVAATTTSTEIRFKSKKAGTHIYSAGFFSFKPQLCNEKDLVGKKFSPSLSNPQGAFLPPVGEGMLPPLPDLPIPPIIPPVPQLPNLPTPPLVPPVPHLPDLPIPPIVPPVPQLPNLPTPPLVPPVPHLPDLPIPPLVPPVPKIPGVPLPPVTPQKSSESGKLSDQKIFGFPFPPNPLQPPTLPPLPLVPSPPSLIPPLPFQPSPPSVLPPIFPSPPPASLFPPLVPLPPVPSLIPSPPPPPPPAFPIPLPPIPPLPGFPGIPPASGSSHLEKTNP